MTPHHHGPDPQSPRPAIDALFVVAAAAPWAVVVAVALSGAAPALLVTALVTAGLATAAGAALRSRVVPVEALAAAERAAGREREAAGLELDASLAEQGRLFGELVAAQAETAAAERRIALAVAGGGIGTWEFDVKAGRVWLSPGFRELLGLETDDFSGDLEWFGAHVHPDDRHLWRAALDQHLEHRTSYAIEVRLRVASGEFRLFRLRGQADWDLTGAPQRLSGTLQDVTERRFAEQRMRESEEMFRSLSAASPVGILRLDAAGDCVWCNDRWQELTELSEFEAMGDGWIAAIEPEDAEGALAAWRECVEGGGHYDAEFRVRRPDGETRHARMRANPVHDEAGRVAGFVATFEDVTEERLAATALAAARDRAMHAAQAKSEFLANMSHEIRTPLNGVIGMAELLRNTALDADQRDYVRTINSSAEALLGIINDILDYSKIEAGKMRIEQVNLDLRTIAEDVAEMLAPAARDAGLELLVAIDPDVPRPVLGDPVRLRQVLSNLASNAIKFTERGEVVLYARCLERGEERCRLRIGVRDTGIGIPPERLAAVFESFTQADGSTTRKYGGTGLGLTICRQLAKLMDGTIHVASQPGVGSEFWVEVPLGVGAASWSPAPLADLTGLRVLVADDHPINRRIFTDSLASWGVHADVVESGEAALEHVAAAAHDPYTIVLLDHRMPGMDGATTAARLHALPGADRRAVVILSSAGGAVAPDSDLPGVRAWLTKPVREAVLQRTLAACAGHAVGGLAPVVELTLAAEFSDLAVLLVEDNEVNRKVAVRMLQKLGCEPDVAANGREGVERVAERAYDLVFMDCQMPEMDGFEATREIRRREALANAPAGVRIVAMTANALEGDRERCLDSGMDDYVAKPIKLDYLIEHLKLARSLRRAA